jgi:multisubunit Na+/H+ antiporter MnhC subunit
MQAVALIRHRGTQPPTIAVMRRKVLAGGIQRPLVPILRRAEPILPRAAATAAVVHLMLAVGEVHHTAAVVAAGRMAVADPMVEAAVLTAIVKISEISIFQKGLPLTNAAGLFFLSPGDPSPIQHAASQLSLCARV